MVPTLYIMSGLSFSGKTTLAKQLVDPLDAQLLSYDIDIWSKYKPTLPEGISKAEEWNVVEAKAREHIAELLKTGNNVIFDDLSVEKRDRDLLRQTAEECGANALVIYMDIPTEVVIQRQKQNETTHRRGLTSDDNMQLVISQLHKPESDEMAVIVNQNSTLDEIIQNIKQKLKSAEVE